MSRSMKDNHIQGEFCRILGITPRNRVLECFMEGREMDFSSGSIAEATALNRATTYRVMEELAQEKYIMPSRRISGAQLYKLNKDKREVKVLLAVFDMILNKIAEEYTTKPSISQKTQKKELLQTA